MERISRAIGTLPEDATVESAARCFTQVLRNDMPEAALTCAALRPTCSAVVYSRMRREMCIRDRGQEVLVRQVAGAVARRIVTYAQRDEECYIDEHLGFIKFGSRVDVYLPLDSEILVKLGQATVGNQTIVARLSGK